jgi:O-succinylbenzoate synthase
MAAVKIIGFNLFRFTLPLVRPLTVKDVKLTERSGLVIELTDERGHTGLSEASPLPGLSPENQALAESQLLSLRYALRGTEIPENLEELSGGFAHWLEQYDLAPSVRFGFETAVLNLIADSCQLPLRRLISDRSRDSISINGLLSGPFIEILDKAARLRDEGYKAIKLKVGRSPLHEDIQLTREVSKHIGNDVGLRLDANRAWGIEDALTFAREVSDCNIDYIEEPVHSYKTLVSMGNKTDLSVAVDESLRELTPEALAPFSNLKAIILKPTLLGFERSIQFGRKATSMGITPVVSSTFETGLGLIALAELAACLNTTDVPVGLGTLDWFVQDLLAQPIKIKRGKLSLFESVIYPNEIRRDLIQEVVCD